MSRRSMTRTSLRLLFAVLVTTSLFLFLGVADQALSAASGWRKQISGTSENLNAVCAVDLNTAWAVGDSGTVRKTTNAGADWQTQNPGISRNIRDIAAADINNAWFVTPSSLLQPTVYRTVDGSTWNSQLGLLAGLNAVSAGSSTHLWAAGGTGTIIKTQNGGDDLWPAQASGTVRSLYGISAVDGNIAWVAGDNGTVRRCDAGGYFPDTWDDMSPGVSTDLRGISAVGLETAWAVGEGGIILKYDTGSWTQQTSGTSNHLNDVWAVDASTVWAVGEGGVILKTLDGGNNWLAQESGVTDDLHAVSAADGDNAWAVGAGGVILRTGSGGFPVPDITSIYPTTGEVGTEVIITGSGFGSTRGASCVTFGGIPATEYTFWSDTEIRVKVPAGVSGNVIVTVVTPGGSDSAPNPFRVGPQAQFTWYFAEGYTGDGFIEYLTLGNPNDTAAPADITYMFPDGSTLDQLVEVPPYSRTTVYVNDVVGAGMEVSCKVTSDHNIVAERPMYFAYQGAWGGGHDTVGAVSPSETWYFAEGYTGPGFDEWICVLNPGDSNADLVFEFQTQEEGLKEVSGFSIAAHSRVSFKVNDLLGSDYQNSLKLESDQPVVAERSMYFDYSGRGGWSWKGGHCVMGIPELAQEYYFAEGTTRPIFEEWLTLQNPNPDPITIQATYQLGDGQGGPVDKTYTLDAATRTTLFVEEEVGRGVDVSVHLSSASDFLAERPTYFDYGYVDVTAQGGHCVIGASAPAYVWFLAEGYTSPGFDEWLTLQNAGPADASARIIYFTQEEGALLGSEMIVSSGTRRTVMVNDDAGSGYQLSCMVVSNQPIVVERPMYFRFGALSGGHDVVAYK